MKKKLMNGYKIKIVLISSPRSGSSYLRTKIDGSNAIFGEVLLKGSQDPLAKQLRKFYVKDIWTVINDSKLLPSDVPGEPSNKGEIVSNFIGLKLMAIDFFNKNFLKSFMLFLKADLLVFTIPKSPFKQIKSLAKIRSGGYAHYYVDEKKINQNSNLSNKNLILSFAIISANLFMQIIIFFVSKILLKRIVLAKQTNFSPAQIKIKNFIDKAIG